MPQVSEVNAVVAALFNPIESSRPRSTQNLFEPSHCCAFLLGNVPAESWGHQTAACNLCWSPFPSLPLRGYRWSSLPSPHVSTPTNKWSTSFAFPKALDYFTTESTSDKPVTTIRWVTPVLSLLLGAQSTKKSGQMLYRYHFWSSVMNLTPGWSFKRV